MRKIKLAFCCLLMILLFLTGCNSSYVNKDIFQFKDSYVGDNSAVGNIINQLQNSEHLTGFELKTKEEPYGVILNYNDMETTSFEADRKETIIYNASFLFALVKNVDWITFDFGSDTYTVTREELQNWYDGEQLRSYTNKEDLRTLIEEYLGDENKVNQLFNH